MFAETPQQSVSDENGSTPREAAFARCSLRIIRRDAADWVGDACVRADGDSFELRCGTMEDGLQERATRRDVGFRICRCRTSHGLGYFSAAACGAAACSPHCVERFE